MADDAADGQQSSRPTRSIMRRRRANVSGGRQDKIEVKTTPDEKKLLEARAKLAGMSVQRLMVTSALSDGRAPSVDYETRRQAWAQACEVRNAIAALGVNMNQIARQANSDQEIPADFAPATAAVTRAMARVLKAFEATFGFEGRRG
ncbi:MULTISPECIES: plasmid mobilization relaxosome protein MobC [Actinomycetes]|uniref:plasmid mobilization protein n=1 Tax=Actinomycetes TaxID=1760 RepID=UPI0006904E17|nr:MULTISPECIES: plasmid mobilization relaxosome protein MobC [Actinomycetes]